MEKISRRGKNAVSGCDMMFPRAVFEPLEGRRLLSSAVALQSPTPVNSTAAGPVMFAATPASVLTKANRQTLLNGLSLPSGTKSTLTSRLAANDLAGFDSTLLSYMTSRSSSHWYFALSDAGSIGNYIQSNVGDGGAVSHADQLLQHMFPSGDDSTTYSYNAGTNVDWDNSGASGVTNVLHTLNRQKYWSDLSQAYRFTGQAKYANELIAQLSSWSAAYPTMSLPTTWNSTDQKSWLLDMGIRVEQWTWSYMQLLGGSAWTKEANTLFMFKIQQQLGYLSTATTYGVADNRSLFHATGWLSAADLFPEMTNGHATAARQLAWDCLDGQYYNDGSHHEQSPGYAEDGIDNLLELKLLDSKNGISWSTARSDKLTKAINAYYQFLTPDGATPALGDTYRTTSATLFLKADIIQNSTLWNRAKPRPRDVWLFGTTVAANNSGNPTYPTLSDRGTSYDLPNSGNYFIRDSGTDPNGTQIAFHAGPKGGQHGHYDPLNFELFSGGKALISDPGLVRYDSSADRTWAVSTPAHNTISADNANVGAMNDIGTGAPGVVVDQWSDTNSNFVQVTAHHFGYDFLSGKPVLSRSIWYDRDGTMLILDMAEGSIAHTYTTSFLVPGQNKSFDLSTGNFHTTNSSGSNVNIQSLLRSGQTANRATKFVSNSPPPNEETSAQRYYVQQTGTYVVFATLVSAYTGTSVPNSSATFITSNPRPGQAIQLSLTKNGSTQTVTFNPPNITRLGKTDGRNNGSYSDLAYDQSGNVHLVYYDRQQRVLKYSEKLKSNGQWTAVETIDNGYLVGSNPSIAVDSTGHAGVAYTDGNAGDLKYAYFNGAQWSVEVADGKGSTGHYPALAFSRKDGPVIAYYNKTGGDLRLASSSGIGGWLIQTIDAGTVGNKDVGRFASLVLDPSRTDASKWAIAYDDGSAGYTDYAIQGKLNGGTYNASTGYTIFHADHSYGGYISLAFDSSNRPSISHYDLSNGDLRFAKSAGSTLVGGISFSASAIASKGTIGTYTAHYYDTAGKAVVLYWDKSHNKLAKARFTTSWAITNLVTGGHEIHVSKYKETVAYTNVDDTGLSVLFM